MKLGLKLRPSKVKSAHDPGHMALYWKGLNERSFRGFRFDIADLPPEYRTADRWRDYLIGNRVPGYVCDDVMILDDIAHIPSEILCLSWDAGEEAEPRIAEHSRPGRYGWYSFTPDVTRETNNCVTWAIGTVRTILGDVIETIETGRVKTAVEQFKSSGAQPSE